MNKLTQWMLALGLLLLCASAIAAPPPVPQNIQQAWLGTESLLLWDDAPDATSYNVYRADNTNTTWTLIGSSSVPRFRDPTLQFLPSFYVVTAVNGDGESAGSDPGTVMFAEQFTITVYEPQSWDGTLSPTNAIVGLATSDVNGGQGLVDWGPDLTNFTGFILNTNYLPSHSFELTNLSPRTMYFYRVTSITSNRAGVNYLGYFATPDTNHPPVAEDYTAWWLMPTNGVWLTLRGYDSNMPPQSLTFRITSQPTNGTLSAIQAGWGWNEAAVTYTPVPGARGYDYFRFVVNNGTWDSAPALVTLTNWFNTRPATTNGSLTTAEDTPVAFSLPVFDAEGDPITFQIEPWSTWNGTVSGTPPNLVFTPDANFNGNAWFWYSVSDGYEQVSGNFTINVTPVDDPPVINTNFLNVPTAWEDQPCSILVSFSDVDWGWDSIYELFQITAPTNGSLGFQGSYAVYWPATNATGPDTFTIAIREVGGLTSAPVTISVDVQPINDPPVALDQDVSTPEDTSIVITPMATDIDSPQVFTFRVRWLSWPTNGWVEETGTNFIYHPFTNFFGGDSFQFDALDDQGWSSWPPGTIHIQVTPVADLTAPENLRRRTFLEDGIVRLWWQEVPGVPSYNVYRADGSNAPFNLLASGVAATNFNDATAQWRQPNFYRVSASDGTNEGPFSGTVFAYPDTTGILTVNDQNWGIHSTTGLVIFFTSVPAGTEGVFEYGTNRNYDVFLENTNILPLQRFSLSNLTPATLYYFRITVTDANGNAIVVSTNYYQDWFVTETWPLANSQSVTATEDTALIITLAGSDPNYHFHPITYSIATGAGHGSLTATGPNTYRYLPTTNYNGADSFTFKVNNGELDSAAATVSINVTPVNDLPVASNILVSLAEDTAVMIPARFSDADGEGVAIGPPLQIVGLPSHGSAWSSGTNLFYQPATNYTGSDSFTYRVTDDYGFGNTATVSLTVTNVNDAPIVTNVNFTTLEDIAFTLRPTMVGFDIESNFFAVQLVAGAAHGTVSISGTNLIYTPTANYYGPDSFTVRLGDGTATSANTTVFMTVTSVNDRPIASGISGGVFEDTPTVINFSSFDPDGGTPIYTVLTLPAHGTLSGSGNSRTYTPATNYFGPDSYTYKVNDGFTDSAPATVSLTIVAINDAPVANPLAVTLSETTSTSFTLTASDVDSGTLTYTVLTTPAQGVLSGTAPSLTYTPGTGFHGGDSFQFTVSDGSLSSTGLISISVLAINHAPTATNLDALTPEDTSVVIAPGGFDEDGDVLTFLFPALPQHGSVTYDGTNFIYVPSANYFGTDAFQYAARDGQLTSAVATVAVTIQPVNDAPVAGIQSVTTSEDSAVNLTLTATDVENDAVTYTIVNGPAHGSLTGSGANLTYTPGANYYGSDSFTFKASDGSADSASASINITVTPVNDVPTADPQTLDTPEDTALPIILTGTDLETANLIYTVITLPTHGSVNGTNSASLTYTPAANYNGSDSFVFRVSDGTNSSSATVNLNITPVNDAPVANAQSRTTPEDTSLSITLTGTDLENDALTYIIVSGPTNGTLSGSGANRIYTPNTNFNGADSFFFMVNDGNADSSPAKVSITVTAVNDPPVPSTPPVTLTEDTSASIVLTASDVEGEALMFGIWTYPQHGTLTGTAPNLVYRPATNFSGTDSFMFAVADGAQWAYGQVNINVTPVNDLPVAPNLSFTVAEEWTLTTGVYATDPDGDTLNYRVVQAPPGTLTFSSNGVFTYRGPDNFNGAVSFAFVASDGTGDGNIGTVTITVTPVNDTPSVTNQTVSTDEDTPITITPLAGDVDGDVLNFTIYRNPYSGLVTVTNGTFVYTPNANFNGNDSFQYQAHDPSGGVNTATVTINVQSVNDAPVSTDKSATTSEDTAVTIMLSATDADGNPLSYRIVTPPAHGTVSGTGTNRVYTPAANYNGSDSFTYTANDGTTDGNIATVSITITAANDVPAATPQSLNTTEDTSLSITLTASDVENDALSYIIVNGPAHGTLSGSGASRTYTPAANYNGPDNFAFKANDGTADGTVATISITVTPVNDVPVANPQNLTTPEDTALPITLTGSDAETANLIYTVITLPAHGSVNVTNSASLIYTPAANYFGADSFTFRVSDGTNISTATVSLDITSVNDAPIANAQSVTVIYNTAKNITLTGSDLEGSTLTYSIVSGPTNGALSGTAPNLTYTPTVGSAGADSFTFRVNDGGSNSTAATVSITTQNPTGIPPAPTSLAITVPTALGTLILNWSCTATNEDGFKVERSLNGSSGWAQIATTGINIHTYTNTGLTSNTRYYYRVRSYNRVGNSAYSGTVNAKAR